MADVDGVLHTRNASTLGGDNDWTITGNNMFSAVSGNVGIGTSSPQSKLHIDETASTSFSVVQIDFDNNPGFQTGGIGIKIEATPLTVKGASIGVRADTSKTGAPREFFSGRRIQKRPSGRF